MNKIKTKVLVGVCSCIKEKSRRDIIRETWLKQPVSDIKCSFFVGNAGAIEEEEKDDTVQMDINDSYEMLPLKVLTFFKYALEHYEFEWLFKCDDDTYIVLDRLLGICNSNFDLIGDISIEKRGAPSGGAGYMLTRALVEEIVANQDKVCLMGSEDLIFGALAKSLGAKMCADKRLILSPFPCPLSVNDLVTCHWCDVTKMRLVHYYYTHTPDAIYSATHTYWNDHILFYKNGSYVRATTGCKGQFQLFEQPARGALLIWEDWNAETLTLDNTDYKGEQLTITPTQGSKALDEIVETSMIPHVFTGEKQYIQIGCGGNYLHGWLNLEQDSCDITAPLYFNNNSIDAIFLEHVIEHVPTNLAFNFFLEAYRVLKPGGVLRLAFPDILQIEENATDEYLKFLQDCGWGDGSKYSAIKSIVTGNGHQAIWTKKTMIAVLKAAGFKVTGHRVGESTHPHLCNIEHHGAQISDAFNYIETACVEAQKP